MPRNISFFMTTPQFIDGTKDVTRRFGWWFLKPGDVLNAVEKSQGLGKGGKIKRLGLIRVVSVRAEPLNAITKDDCRREGFPDFEPTDFVKLLTVHYKCFSTAMVNRIEFERLPDDHATGFLV